MGPLQGIKIIEFAGIGPGPFCAMMLSDMGAEVVRIDRKVDNTGGIKMKSAKYNVLARGRRSVALDLKKPEAVEAALKLIEGADALIEGFRPGVMERLGLGPDVCLARNPKLVYGRMTGWGQDGPIAHTAGHDINYIALSGMLHCIGEPGGKPTPPLNLVGDFGGGGMMLAFGVACGIVEAQRSGKGQVIDSSMHEGAAALGAMFFSMRAQGMWTDERGDNLLDGGAHFYGTYETSDGKYVSIGSIEPQFYAELLQYAGVNDPDFKAQMKREGWPELKNKLQAIFKTKTRDEWTKIMQDTDICYAPVLNLEEALQHEHNIARKSFVEIDGVPQPAPTPRFSRTVAEIQRAPVEPGTDNEPVLRDWGFSPDAIDALRAAQAI